MTCESCTTELDGILYSQESVELAVVQGGDNHSSLPDYLVNTIQLGAPWNSTVLNCGNPCTSQTIDLESIGLAAGDVYTVWLRETNAARVVGKGLLSPPHGLASDVPRAENLLFQPSGARALVGEQRAHHHHGQHAPHGAPQLDAVHAAWPRQPNLHRAR